MRRTSIRAVALDATYVPVVSFLTALAVSFVIAGGRALGHAGGHQHRRAAIQVQEVQARVRPADDHYRLSAADDGSGKNESRQQEISDISRSLKALARELHVPVIALSQLSRAVEQRPDHRPMLSDLRESGAIEQDADVVMFIYRDDYYNKDTELKNVAEIIIAKQRNGAIGTINLAWLPDYTQFANLAK